MYPLRGRWAQAFGSSSTMTNRGSIVVDLYDPKVVHLPPPPPCRRGRGLCGANCTKVVHPVPLAYTMPRGCGVARAERASTHAVEMMVCGCKDRRMRGGQRASELPANQKSSTGASGGVNDFWDPTNAKPDHRPYIVNLGRTPSVSEEQPPRRRRRLGGDIKKSATESEGSDQD